MANDAEALNSFDTFACHRLNLALRTIHINKMGNSVVGAAVQRIKLSNVKTKTDAAADSTNGIPNMNCAYASNWAANSAISRYVMINGQAVTRREFTKDKRPRLPEEAEAF